MSNIIRKSGSHAVYGGVSVDIAEEGLDQVTQLLAGLRGGAYKAMGSALARAANSGKTVAKREVAKKYTISQSDFLAQTRDINHCPGDIGPCLCCAHGRAYWRIRAGRA